VTSGRVVLRSPSRAPPRRGPATRAPARLAGVYRDDVDRLFADLFPGGRHGASNEARAPVDVYLTDGPPPSLTVEIDVAGIDPAHVDVQIVDDVLVVRGERRRTGAGRRAYQHAEIAWGPFERRLRLGVAVDASRAGASYEAGILRVRLPLAPVTPPRRVEITVRDS
jgi:HSP20 family protein